METYGAVGEQRFDYSKGPIGRSRNVVVVDDRELQIEFPMSKVPIHIPWTDVAAVVRVHELVDEEVVYRRDVRVLDLPATAFSDANAVVVLRSPRRMGPFTYGAEKFLSISGRERKHGLDADAIGVTVEDPDGLVAAAVARGASVQPTVAAALRSVVGEATGVEAELRRGVMARRRSRTRAGLVILGLLWAMLLSLRFSLRGDEEEVAWSVVLGAMGSALAWAVLVGTVVALVAPRRRRVRASVSAGFALGIVVGGIALIAVPFTIAARTVDDGGTSRTLVAGLVGGVPAGAFMGWALARGRQA